MPSRLHVLAASVLLAAACGRIGYEGGAAVEDGQRAVDGAVDDGARPADGGGLADELVRNGGCEDGIVGWYGWRSELGTSPVARTGAASCAVCMDPGRVECTIDDAPDTVLDPVLGDRYRASAWVRAVPGGSAGRTSRLVIREWADVENMIMGAQSPGDTVALSESTWTRVSATHTVTAAGHDALDLFVYEIGVGGDCMLVDDVSLVRE